MSNIRTMPGLRHPDDAAKPNQDLISGIKQLLQMAESGQLQCFIGTGFTCDGLRLATWADHHEDRYQMLGALAWLQHEYVHRHTGEPA